VQDDLVHVFPNLAAEPGYEYGQEARLLFGPEYCHKLAQQGEILSYYSRPQSEWGNYPYAGQ
jgi:hypothetical protein